MTIEKFTRVPGRRPWFDDQPQDAGEQVSGNRELCHLEGDVAAMLTSFAPFLTNITFRLVTEFASGLVKRKDGE
jgi:hypothetical protein